MQRTDFANNDLQRSEYETACRDFWSASVMVETGRRPDDGNSLKEDGGAAVHLPCGPLIAPALGGRLTVARSN